MSKTGGSTKLPWLEAVGLIVWPPPPLPTGSLYFPSFACIKNHQDGGSMIDHNIIEKIGVSLVSQSVLSDFDYGRERVEYIVAQRVHFEIPHLSRVNF